MVEHEFTKVIREILAAEYGGTGRGLFDASPLLQYLNLKTRAASRGSKARGAFANHYALYVLVEDYLRNGYDKRIGYAQYEGARYADLLARQRALPFGSKLQNHALNHRLNEEFKKYFPTIEFIPILRDVNTNRYWINENLLIVEIDGKTRNIAKVVITIINAYVEAKRDAFKRFIADCESLAGIQHDDPGRVREFIAALLRPNVDARVFEIVSYAILKQYYGLQKVYFGWTRDTVGEACLVLYKTGRTNANDGGIDFVMKPVGRFYQVTETVDARKYFLDIDKVERFPLTFVVKSADPVEVILARIREQATRLYRVERVVERYMGCIEEILNLPSLTHHFERVLGEGRLEGVVQEIVRQSRMEFNYQEAETEVENEVLGELNREVEEGPPDAPDDSLLS